MTIILMTCYDHNPHKVWLDYHLAHYNFLHTRLSHKGLLIVTLQSSFVAFCFYATIMADPESLQEFYAVIKVRLLAPGSKPVRFTSWIK